MWNRERFEAKYQFPFGDATMQVMQTAEKEARRFDHNRVGTEHLLAAYVSVGNQRVAESLGLELNKVRSAIEFQIGRRDRTVVEEDSFTPRVIKVLELSVDEARRFGDKELEPDHIMLGIVRNGEGIAARVIETLGAPLERVRAAVVRNRINAPKPEAPTYLNTLDRIRAFFEDSTLSKEKNKYTAMIIIDGLKKQEMEQVRIELKKLKINYHKIRGMKDEQDAVLRLADSIAGFLRDHTEDQVYTKSIFNKFQQAKIITAV